MAKRKTVFVCQACGQQEPRWMGKCDACDSWNTFVEEIVGEVGKAPVMRSARPVAARSAQRLRDVQLQSQPRLVTGLAEFDRVLGGGVMEGSLVLLAGDPGIGKSTLVTELGRRLPDSTLLYVTGEESAQQVKLRAERMGVDADQFYLLAETNVESILAAAQDLQPDLLIVDSIQTLFRPDLTSAPGSVAQVRESAAALMDLAKTQPLSTILIGHVTKAGSIAGPRVLEHMVDTVLHFEGDRHHAYRILRAVKNRFGPAHEVGVFEMRDQGLVEVGNPSALFLQERTFGTSGSVVVCAMEGTRPLLVEVQALVSTASYGTPQRTTTGFDARRLQLLLAVLEKREGYRVSTQDVFLNIAGGVRLEEPAADLGVAVAVASSMRDTPTDSATIVMGEVGLGGELRAVSRLESRLAEARQLGFERALIPASGRDGLQIPKGLDLLTAPTLSAALNLLL